MRDGTQQLPGSSRDALLRIADELRAKFTGTFTLECHEGGVRKVEENRTWRPSEKEAG